MNWFIYKDGTLLGAISLSKARAEQITADSEGRFTFQKA